MKILYKDECGTYSITVHTDKTATVRHNYKGAILFKKEYVGLDGAKRALSRYCGGMPKQISIHK